MRVALLFPGQGAQRQGFLRRLPDHAAVRATLAEASAILGQDATTLDEAGALKSTVAVQLSTVIAGVAVARALGAEGLSADAVAGLSVGAFTAAVACDALTLAAALPLVKLRGEGMARAAPPGCGMLALLGLTERDARQLVARVNERVPLYLASVNAPTEMVVSGEEAALCLASDYARAAGATARALQVAIPSHCPLMDQVSSALREALARVHLGTPRLAYVMNHRARIAADGLQVAEDLILNVSRPVRWHDSVTLLYELGCRLYIEAPPGCVLTNLVKSSFPQVRAVALQETSLASAVTAAGRLP
jgi:malonate decarboxylase epsilon subunit